MKTNAGLWIDHREAIIVTLSAGGEETKRIQSTAVKQHAVEMPADDLRQKEFTEHLAHYYDAIIAHLREAGAIVIFGPGEAKGELKKRFETHKSETRAIVMETTDNMTEPQVAARVRHHFHQDLRRGV
ncbi:MAG: hypothetical protein PHS14_10790 [Elusimicrobia bacterium]|nr:hypothetical protein [Elusimicrobiota bacterium]